jgi:hypothetical protein
MAVLVGKSDDGERVETVIRGAFVCTTCLECQGTLEVHEDRIRNYVQSCSCDRAAGRDEPWPPGWDISRYIELCHCCGVEIVRSGSRWSLFFCPDCKQLVLDLNRAAGRWVIPIGRHSMMHGTMLGATASREAIEEFTSEVEGLFASIDHLHEHASRRIRANLADAGLAGREAVTLDAYLEGVAAAGVRKEIAFERLREHFVGRRGKERAVEDEA